MMRLKQKSLIFMLFAVVATAAFVLPSGCGGGGNKAGTGSSQSSGVTQDGINGKVAATVKLTGRVAGRMAAQSEDATVNVTITISGVYSGDDKEFPAVATTYPINLSQGYARVSVTSVPTGVNHLLVAVADWGGATETVKAIVPLVEKGVNTTVIADVASTVVADAAIYLATKQDVRLADLASSTIASIGQAVAAYATQEPYSSMTPENVLAFLDKMNVPEFLAISPASANVVAGETLQLTAMLYDANNMLMPSPPATWSFSPQNVGSITSTGGLLSAIQVGPGNVTVSSMNLTSSAEISVIASCTSDTDCGDGLPLTLDGCNLSNAGGGACTHTPITCITKADCSDNDALTLDTCANSGTVSASCTHATFACNDALDCDDNNVLSIDICSDGGTATAVCSHHGIDCNTDTDCNDNDAMTIDTCTNAGTVSASCAQTAMPTVVTAVVPQNNAAGIAINTKLTAVFSNAMATETINTSTFTLKQGETPVSGTVTYSGVTGIFIPGSNLAPNTLYTVTITTGATDLAGAALAAGYTWRFTTGSTPDITAPLVTGTINSNGATNVDINTKVSPAFSEAMDPLTITKSTITLKQGATIVSGAVTYSGLTAVLIPDSHLAPNTLYTAVITTGVKDLAGNAMADAYTWSFTTGAIADTTAPTVTLTIPFNGETDVPIGNKLTATFSEAMNPLMITTLTFKLKQGATAVSGTVTYSGVNAVFIPDGSLAPNTLYTALITTSALDLAGNAVAASYTWDFTTGSTPDTIPPITTLTAPVHGAVNVPIGNKIAGTFSEWMDPLTITTITFTLMRGTTPVSGIVTYSGVTAAFTPYSDLAPNTVYTATITTGATDLAGNALEEGYTWNFTTGAAHDTSAPMVISTVPANGASGGVPISHRLTATFNEAMDPLSITATTFTLKQGGTTTVSGTVTYSGVTAVFIPYRNLAPNTYYTAMITTGARDLAGNAQAGDAVWRFTTASGADTNAPFVTLTVPANAAMGVCVNKEISATFSEAMDPLTVTRRHFFVDGIRGTVTYSAINKVATFVPRDNFAPNTHYHVTMRSHVKDLSGIRMSVDKEWSFTTGITTCSAP